MLLDRALRSNLAQLGGLALQRLGGLSFTPTPPDLPAAGIPRHVAVILDGNGRWATEHGLSRTAGHEAGMRVLGDIAEGALQIGVRYLSAYCFSTENWTRPASEVAYLFGMLQRTCNRLMQERGQRQIRIRWAGRRTGLPPQVLGKLDEVERATAVNDSLTLVLCVNYGGRAEITDAIRRIARDVAGGAVRDDSIDDHLVASHLYLPDLPDVDLLIRTSGEQRISNFLLWQAAYAEIFFEPVPWPEFSRQRFFRAIESYASRDRRFGSHAPSQDASDDPSGTELAVRVHPLEAGHAGAHDARQAIRRLRGLDVHGTMEPLRRLAYHAYDACYATAFHRALGPAGLVELWEFLDSWVSSAVTPTDSVASRLVQVLRLSLEIASFSMDIDPDWLDQIHSPGQPPGLDRDLLDAMLAGTVVSRQWSDVIDVHAPRGRGGSAIPQLRSAIGSPATGDPATAWRLATRAVRASVSGAVLNHRH